MILDVFTPYHSHYVKIANKFAKHNPDDAIQDAYLKVYNRFEKCPEKALEMKPEQIKYYMYCAIRSAAFINYSKENKFTDLPEKEIETEELDMDFELENELLISTLEDRINSWHWYDKRIFELHVKKGLSLRKIASETHISVSSIFNTIKKSKIDLKEYHENLYGGQNS